MDVIETYISELQANNRAINTIKAYKLVLNKLAKIKPIEQFTKADMVAFFRDFKGSESTKALFQVTAKTFFRTINKADVVDWIEVIKPDESLRPDEILTVDDVQVLIDATDSLFYKALMAFLFDTGARIGEVMAVHYSDFEDTTDGTIVYIPTFKTRKRGTGIRKVVLRNSIYFIRNLQEHIHAKPEDLIFNQSYEWMEETMRCIGEKDDGKNGKVRLIKKPTHPHAWRHASATEDARRGMSEDTMRYKYGWSKNSTMPQRYKHLVAEDHINNQKKAQGKLIVEAVRKDIEVPAKPTLTDNVQVLYKVEGANQRLQEAVDKLSLENYNLQNHIQKMTNDYWEAKDKLEEIKEKEVAAIAMAFTKATMKFEALAKTKLSEAEISKLFEDNGEKIEAEENKALVIV